MSTETAQTRKTFQLPLRSWLALLLSGALVIAGIVIIAVGFSAKSQVRNTLKAEQIAMTPDAPQIVGMKAGTPVDSAATADAMARIIRHHSLEATGGLVYAVMPRYASADGKGTNDPAKALIDPKTKQPMDNGARNIWVTSTTWRTSLGLAEMGFKLSDFVSGVGALFLLVGLGIGIAGVKREPLS